MSAFKRRQFHRQVSTSGFSLVELMVAVTIGVFLIIGAVTVQTQSRSAFLVAESAARIQENARLALDTMEPDFRLAGFWGLHNDLTVVSGRTGNNPIGVGVINDCAVDWTLTLVPITGGSNNAHPGWNCFPEAQYVAGTDVVSVRRASSTATPTAALENGMIYLRSTRTPFSQIFQGTVEPGGFPATAENFELTAAVYYVRPWSMGDAGVNDAMPSLRRLSLDNPGGVATLVDQEVVSGVEEFQVQYGVDIDPDTDPAIDRYVNADNPMLLQPGARVRSVRIWLLVRSDQPEVGFVDDGVYQVADRLVAVPANAQNFRRTLISRTIFLRNEG